MRLRQKIQTMPWIIFLKMIHVVVGIVKNLKNQFLVAKRLAGQDKGGLWEFPGGKVEPGELALSALLREFNEEIAIQITDASPWIQVPYQYTNKSVLLDVWIVHGFAGEPQGAEGQQIDWKDYTELLSLEFPEANKAILEKLPGI
jgi:8-oxo-dGTP diphosphatase